MQNQIHDEQNVYVLKKERLWIYTYTTCFILTLGQQILGEALQNTFSCKC